MKVRSVANGNEIDLPADHGLVVAGIYVPVEDDPPEPLGDVGAEELEPAFTPSDALEDAMGEDLEDEADDRPVARRSLQTLESPVMTTAHLDVAPIVQRRPYKQGRKPRTPRKPG